MIIAERTRRQPLHVKAESCACSRMLCRPSAMFRRAPRPTSVSAPSRGLDELHDLPDEPVGPRSDTGRCMPTRGLAQKGSHPSECASRIAHSLNVRSPRHGPAGNLNQEFDRLQSTRGRDIGVSRCLAQPGHQIWKISSMKMVAEHLQHAIQYERIAAAETRPCSHKFERRGSRRLMSASPRKRRKSGHRQRSQRRREPPTYGMMRHCVPSSRRRQRNSLRDDCMR